jgi:hypothetical protein
LHAGGEIGVPRIVAEVLEREDGDTLFGDRHGRRRASGRLNG